MTLTQRILLVLFLFFLLGCAAATTSYSPEKTDSIAPHIYDKDYSTVFIKAVDAASAMGWQVTFTDKSTGVISAKTPTNIWTWGDSVSIRVSRIEGDKVRVNISSGTQGQVIDWGRNRRNIISYLGKLDNLIYKIE